MFQLNFLVVTAYSRRNGISSNGVIYGFISDHKRINSELKVCDGCL